MQDDRGGRRSLTFKIVAGMGAGLGVGLLLNRIGVSGWIETEQLVVDQ